MKLRRITNNLATGIITAGGVALVLVVAGILVFILSQTIPLWIPAVAELRSSFSLTGLIGAAESDILLIGEEEQKEIMYAVTNDGRLHFISLADGKLLKTLPIAGTHHLAAAVTIPATHRLILVTRNGQVEEVEIKFGTLFEKSGRTVVPELKPPMIWFSDSSLAGSTHFTAAQGSNSFLAAWLNDELSVSLFRSSPDSAKPERRIISATHPVSSLIVNPFNQNILLGLTNGQIDRWRWNPAQRPELMETSATRSPYPVTTMMYLIGDVMLVVGNKLGQVEAWMLAPAEGSTDGQRLTMIRTFQGQGSPIRAMIPSWRNKSFLTADARGVFRLYHSTSEQLLIESSASPSSLRLGTFSPKSDGAIIMDNAGQILNYYLNNPHPEISAKTLWNEVWYESYSEPTYTWQSTGGTDDFEPKLSLIPLIFGTIKGTLYAMFFAVPLAIMGALYTSQFAHPKIRAFIKPTVEIMAALPSVVIGFMAGLWLAPLVKDSLAGFFVSIFLVPILLVGFVTLLERLPRAVINRFKFGYEVFLMMPTLLVAIVIGSLVGGALENLLMDGDAQNWLYTNLNVGYDQRNCIVVGAALAFASMPIIFTITEDSLSSVPAHLTSASLALGATRWQTAVKVILPAASAGIFSAVMIGFGRAIGETMIVLMATGNTPIMDWSIFNGMRTLSANIAVEIPEAPQGGTLYRVLFLSGLILFLMTFVVNTMAETVRQRLRKKYESL